MCAASRSFICSVTSASTRSPGHGSARQRPASISRPGGIAVARDLIPSRSVGSLGQSFDVTTNTLSRLNLPIKRPSSRMTLSRGASVAAPLEVTTSSGVTTRSANSTVRSVCSKLSIVVRESGKTSFVHRTGSVSLASCSSTARANDRPSDEDPMNTRGLGIPGDSMNFIGGHRAMPDGCIPPSTIWLFSHALTFVHSFSSSRLEACVCRIWPLSPCPYPP